MAEPQPQITPPPALPPPLIGTDVPGSAPGIPQPVIATGGESLPPSFPLGEVGTWLPPPLIGEGENELAAKPVVPPGTGLPGVVQPQFRTGSATVPATLFPEFTTTSPSPPIVVANIQMIGDDVPPSTPTVPQIPPGGPPINVTLPVVTATGLEVGSGNFAETTDGTWSNVPGEFTYQWLRDGAPILGATAPLHPLVPSDVGFLLSCAVRPSNLFGVATAAVSNEVGPITDGTETDPEADPEPVRATVRVTGPERSVTATVRVKPTQKPKRRK